MKTSALLPLVTFLSATAAAQVEAPKAPDAGTAEERLARVVARPGGLTAADVGRKAAATSPDLRAKNAEIVAAAHEVDKALVAYAPRLTLTARYVRLSPIDAQSFGPSNGRLVATPAPAGPLPPGAPLVAVPGDALSFPVILDQYTLQANVTVPVSDYFLRTGDSHDSAKEARQSAVLAAKVAERDARASGELAYYDWVRARLSQVVAELELEQASSHLAAARALADQDRIPRAEVLKAQAGVARAELLLERSKTLTLIGEDRLRTAMHDTSGRSYQIGEDLFADDAAKSVTRARPATAVPSTAQLLTQAERQRPELAALRARERALAAQRRALRGATYPRLDAFGNAYYANPNSRFVPQREEWQATWDLGAQLTWTPNDSATAASAAGALAAKEAAVRAELSRARDGIRAEVYGAERALREAEIAARTARRGVAAAEEYHRSRLELFREGRATSVELADAETDLLRARLDLVNAHVDRRVARVRLWRATGAPVAR